MTQARNNAWSTVGLAFDLLSLPYNFLLGLVLGLAVPVAAIAAAVAGVRLLTGRMPFLSQNRDAAGERYLALHLVSPEEAGDLFAAQKQAIANDLGRMQAEIRSILAEAQAQADEVAIEA